MVELESKLNKLLLELFQEHGVDGFFIDAGSTILLDKCIKAHCHLFDKTSGQTALVQLDVIFEVGLDKKICESCAGLGSDLDTAANDSFKSFVRNSFHTILAAFFTPEHDDQISRNEWIIKSEPYEVISSPLGIRGKKPELLSTLWIEQFEKVVKKQKFESGINWIRLFYAISNNQVTTCEVLVNNDTESSIQNTAHKFNVTLTKDFYTLRLFYILQSGLDIGRLAAVLSWASLYYGEDDYDIIKNTFKGLGMSDLDIDKAYIMIPLAISHVFIEKIAPNALKTEATIINKAGQTFEIDLRDEFFFTKSYDWAKDRINNNLIDRDSLISILQMSSLFNTLNNALNSGANPEDLEFSGTILTLGDYTIDEQKQINMKQKDNTKKPFWKFW